MKSPTSTSPPSLPPSLPPSNTHVDTHSLAHAGLIFLPSSSIREGKITSEPMTNFDKWLVSEHLQGDGTDRLLHLSSSSKPWAVPSRYK